MTADIRDAQQVESPKPRPVNYLIYLLIGLVSAVLWTLVGTAIAFFFQADAEHFLWESITMQVPACFGLAISLFLIARSGALTERTQHITQEGFAPPQGVTDSRLRVLIILLIAVAGTASIIGMGFNLRGAALIFMWVTVASICIAAGMITLHTIDLLLIVHHLQNTKIKTFNYSSARTPELRHLVSYFTWFTLILSIAYCFAFVGTLRGHWNASPLYIQAVQWFWPVVYVPTCSVALIYPHLAIHGLIQRAKERTLLSYQLAIDKLLVDYPRLENEQIAKINTLAQLFDRISATPDYVIDIGIGFRTVLPLLFNVVILIAKPLLGQS